MGKSLFIAEKPSVAMEFAKALDMNLSSSRKDGYVEDDQHIVTWCVGHLIGMMYPEAYGEEFKKWSFDTLPFIPKNYKYGVLPSTKDQYKVVSSLLNRKDVDKIYYSGDSAREGEYIQRLVRQMAGHNENATEYRVWIDSQTREEILNGIHNAHELSYYDSLNDSAYARAIEDYLIGINFSRALSLKYGNLLAKATGKDHAVIAVGRVMSCVLGMIVERERQVRSTVIVPFYGIKADSNDLSLTWTIKEGSKYINDPDKYSNQGMLKKEKTEELIHTLSSIGVLNIVKAQNSRESKQAPLLFNLAELQGECSRLFHISPADTLVIAQKLYEKKLTTYPRTDARVLTTAISKVYEKNIRGLQNIPVLKPFSEKVLGNQWQDNLRNKKTKYIDDSKVSDHYAIIPTGEGFENYSGLNDTEKAVYQLVAKRFLAIFYPAAEYAKSEIIAVCNDTPFTETFTTSVKALAVPGYLEVEGKEAESSLIAEITNLASLNGTAIPATFSLREGKSTAPKRYTTGSMILAMENAGNLIDDPDLREQIHSSGIGTSATRADVITKLEKDGYIAVNKKTQIITPDCLGELIYDVLHISVPNILNPKYTASWEKGLQQIVNKEVSKETYLNKMDNYVSVCVNTMKHENHGEDIVNAINDLKPVYPALTEVKKEPMITCPVCGKPMAAGKMSIFCTGYKEKTCNFSVWRTVGQKTLTDSVLKKMIETTEKQPDGTYESQPSQELKGFVSKAGKTFSAKVYVSYDGTMSKMKYMFSNNR